MPNNGYGRWFAITTYPQSLTLVIGDKGESVSFMCNDFIPGGTELKFEGYDEDIVEVKTGSFTSAMCEFIVIFTGKAVGTTSVTVGVYQGTTCLTSATVLVTVEAPDEEIETITAEMDNPVYGQKVLSTSSTVSAVPMGAVKVIKEKWGKFPTDTDPDLAEDVTDPDEVFQEGYEYFYTVRIEVEEGYEVTEDTKCTFNDKDDEISMQGNYFILEETFTPSEAPTEEPTTEEPTTEEPTTEEPTTEEPTTEEPTTKAPTTEAPTTEAPSDNPKTGDSNNMWLYVLAGVLALGALGGVVLKKKTNR